MLHMGAGHVAWRWRWHTWHHRLAGVSIRWVSVDKSTRSLRSLCRVFFV